MPTLSVPGADLEYLVTGSGSPVTVFAHGLAASIADTRPLGSGVSGTRVFFHFRGHGRSSRPDTGWDYETLAGDLRAVADSVGATHALGVSMGAGALLALLAATPDRFERLVLFLPAALDTPRTDAAVERLESMAAAIEAGDAAGLEELLRSELPPAVLDLNGVEAYLRGRARQLAATGTATALRGLPGIRPVTDRSVLAGVTAPALVIGQDSDPLHPSQVARELAEALPDAALHVFRQAGSVWLHRRQLRAIIAGFLDEPADAGRQGRGRLAAPGY